MKEYIEREAIKSGMIRYGFTAPDMTVTEFVEDELPAADVVEVIHAHWVTPSNIGGRSFDVPHCSHCKEIPCGVDMNTHYCPNCGAKMDGGANDGKAD